MYQKSLTSLSGGRPVKTSQSQENEKRGNEQTLRMNLSAFVEQYDLNGSSGKTSPEFFLWAQEEHFIESCGSFPNAGMGGHTGFLTLSTGESHSGEEESFLSDILEEIQDVPEKYYLSKRACEGILRRAEKRGKALPRVLKDSLTSVISRLEPIVGGKGHV